ncbi:Glycosyltransferase, family 2 [Halococcus morrhuae DSM 1307]|uniref:Glycosyltransferase, family 2 n=2 Tax=Halococcus morrhuae TaxID=2250 RepID=M0MKV0_HALMO|nr:Glycosyltransferase, family 2 [Halococcus morrhuae DSM 1307]
MVRTRRMTLVSAILPTYNRADYVSGAIDTVLKQSHDEIEVVVVDDGSTDDTTERLAAYEDDDRVRVRHNEENRGISASMNRAAELADGEFVCVLNDDDRWHEEKVEKQLAAFERANDEVGVVYTGGVVKQGERVVRVYRPERRGDIYPDVIARFGLHPHSSHMLRAECFELGGFDSDFPRGVDWDHCIRLAQEYEFEYVDERLVERIFHTDNISQQLTHGVEVNRMIWEKYREEIESHPDIERRLREKQCRAHARVALERGQRRRAFAYARRAMGYERSAESAFIMLFALLGQRALGAARRARDAVMNWRATGSNTDG